MSKTPVSLTDRAKAVALHAIGHSLQSIATIIGRAKSTVQYIIKTKTKSPTLLDEPRTGRPRISTPRDDRRLIRLSLANRRASSTVLAARWELSSGKRASPRTVRSILKAHKMNWCAGAVKPRLTPKHLQKRREFCEAYKHWTAADWRRVVFSDEMNIEVDNRKGRCMLRRRPGERYHPDCVVERTR